MRDKLNIIFFENKEVGIHGVEKIV